MIKFSKPIAGLFLCIFFMISFTSEALSQRDLQMKNIPHYDYRPYHFGFLLGLNQMDFALRPVENLHKLDLEEIGGHNFDSLHSVLPHSEYGFNIGIVSNLKLGEQFDLRFIPTLTFGDRIITYEGVREDGRSKIRNQTIESTFLDFPLHVKYKSVRMTNTRVYLLGGLKYSHDLASVEDKDDPDSDLLVSTLRNDLYYELGIGFDHYFYYFKFSTEIKASFGLRDILQENNTIYSKSIDGLKSQIFQISFLFE